MRKVFSISFFLLGIVLGAQQGFLPIFTCLIQSGSQIISGTELGDLLFWDPETGLLITEIQAHRTRVDILHWINDSSFVSSSRDGTTFFWSKENEEWSKEILFGNSELIRGMSYHPLDNILAASTESGNIYLWELPDPFPYRIYRNLSTLPLNDIEFSPSGNLLFIGGEGGELFLWNRESDLAPLEIPAEVGPIQDIQYLNQKFLILGKDGRMKYLDQERGEWTPIENEYGSLIPLIGGTGQFINQDGVLLRLNEALEIGKLFNFSPKHSAMTLGEYLFAITSIGQIGIWQQTDGSFLTFIGAPILLSPFMDWIEPGPLLLPYLGENAIQLDSRTGEISLLSENPPQFLGRINLESPVITAQGHEGLILGGFESGLLRLHNSQGGVLLTRNLPPNEIPRTVDLIKDKHIASGTASGKIYLWNWKDSNPIYRYDLGNSPITSLHITEEWLVWGTHNGQVKILDLERLELMETIRGHQDRISDIRISPEGRFLLTVSWDLTTKIWNMSDQRLFATLTAHEHRPFTGDFLDETSVLTISNKEILIHDWRREFLIDSYQGTFEGRLIPSDVPGNLILYSNTRSLKISLESGAQDL